jgi:hypothetical protein
MICFHLVSNLFLPSFKRSVVNLASIFIMIVMRLVGCVVDVVWGRALRWAEVISGPAVVAGCTDPKPRCRLVTCGFVEQIRLLGDIR